MDKSYLNLFLENYNKLLELESISDDNIVNIYNALFGTIKDINFNLDRLRNCISIIKADDDFHSHFRGKYLLNIATDISLRENEEINFKYMMNIDKILVNTFNEANFISLTTQIICYFKDKALDKIISSLKEANSYLIETNKISIELNDLVFHTFIACNYPNYIDKFKEIEESFNLLCKLNYSRDQSLNFAAAIPLSLSEKPIKNRVLDLLNLTSNFESENIDLPKEISCVLSYLSVIIKDIKSFISLFKAIDNELLFNEYFEPNALNKRFRLILTLSLSLVTYFKENNNLNIKNKFVDPLCIILINISTCENISKSAFLYPSILSK